VVDLAACVAPWSVDAFLGEYWERESLLIRRKEPDHFHGLISLGEFDAIVSGSALRHPYFRVFKDGASVPVSRTTTMRQLGGDVDHGLADLNQIYDLHAEGATLVLQALERWWPSFFALCRDFELLFGFPTQAHAYATPADAQGTPVHYDTHDVFVLQVEGSKRWRVWEPLRRLPMRMSEDRYDADAVTLHARSHTPIIDVELTAGDSLYLPRGFVHEVRTESERSLHVTVSVMMDRWADLAEAVIVERLLDMREIVDFRASLPFGRTPFAEPDEAMQSAYGKLTAMLLDGLDLERGLALMRRKMVAYAAPPFRGRLLDLVALESVSLTQQVCLREDAIFSVTETTSGDLLLSFGGASTTFPAKCAPALEHVVSAGSFSAGELPGAVTDEERLAITRRLLATGLCTLAALDR
jgi:bifunctional lysine-specific demethylase and histidyl-hydroxylase NO66